MLLLRAFLGVTFVFAGSQKLANPNFFSATAPGSFQEQLGGSMITSPLHHFLAFALHAPVLIAVLIAFGEIAVGLGTLLGLFGRLAATGGAAAFVVVLPHCELQGQPLLLRAGHRVLVRVDAVRSGRAGHLVARPHLRQPRRARARSSWVERPNWSEQDATGSLKTASGRRRAADLPPKGRRGEPYRLGGDRVWRAHGRNRTARPRPATLRLCWCDRRRCPHDLDHGPDDEPDHEPDHFWELRGDGARDEHGPTRHDCRPCCTGAAGDADRASGRRAYRGCSQLHRSGPAGARSRRPGNKRRVPGLLGDLPPCGLYRPVRRDQRRLRLPVPWIGFQRDDRSRAAGAGNDWSVTHSCGPRAKRPALRGWLTAWSEPGEARSNRGGGNNGRPCRCGQLPHQIGDPNARHSSRRRGPGRSFDEFGDHWTGRSVEYRRHLTARTVLDAPQRCRMKRRRRRPAGSRNLRRARLVPGITVVVAVGLAVLALQVSGLLAGGVASRGPARTAARSGLLSVGSPSRRSPGTGLPAIEAGLLPWQLAAPISREVVLPAPTNRLLIAGGLDSAGASVPGIFTLGTSNGRLTLVGDLSVPTHDAAGVVIGRQALVFGGGTTGPSSTAQRFEVPGTVEPSGYLPAARADAAATSIGGTAYVVGGYDGAALDPEVLATTDGLHYTEVARLAVAVRYPAVAALDGKILCFRRSSEQRSAGPRCAGRRPSLAPSGACWQTPGTGERRRRCGPGRDGVPGRR